jgi:hypothetical protein
MFKAQYKTRNPYETWNILGMYNSAGNAISSAMLKKKHGALMVRVIDKHGAVIYVQ